MTNSASQHVFICAGEASGDLLGGSLATSLHHINAPLKLTGVGGQHMQDAGVELIQDLSKMGIIGFIDVLKNLGNIRKTINHIKNHLARTRPDVVVFIDYPGMNLRLAEYAKKIGLKVFFYVSPQIWAWRYGRIKKIRQRVDHMAVLYRFEEDIYKRENIPVSFVGHPIKQLAVPTLSKSEVYSTLNLNQNHPVIALFPGSRTKEIERLLDVILDAKKEIQKTIPQAQFVLPIASTLDKTEIKKCLPDDVTIVENNTYNLLSISDAAIATSGTATLEIGLMGVPLVVIYKIPALTYHLLKHFIKTRHIGLCNIIAEDAAAKEFIQHDVTAKNIAEETLRLLQNEEYRLEVKTKLAKIQHGIGDGNTADKAAAAVLSLLS